MAKSEGSFEAKLVDYGFSVTKNNALKFVAKFITRDKETYDYSQIVKPKEDSNAEYFYRDLERLGLDATTEFKVLAGGLASNALKVDKIHEIVVAKREHEGKTYYQVKYINSGMEKLPEAKADEMLRSLGYGLNGGGSHGVTADTLDF